MVTFAVTPTVDITEGVPWSFVHGLLLEFGHVIEKSPALLELHVSVSPRVISTNFILKLLQTNLQA